MDNITAKIDLGDFGENRYYFASGQKLKGCEIAVNRWYDGRLFWDFKNPDANGQAGLFGQIVWKRTKTLGCARKYIEKDEGWWKSLVICIYYPIGNVIDEYPENVSPVNQTKITMHHQPEDEHEPVNYEPVIHHEHERGHDYDIHHDH